ncbi:MAG: hypothetical protein WCF71_18260 [Verrucomicrobiia bacterium]
MLKRHGELCQHEVPGFPGLLTDSEHEAYVEMVEYMKEELQFHNHCKQIIAGFEKQVSRLKILVSAAVPKNAQSITMGTGDKWQILDVFFKEKDYAELLFCSRSTASETEFSIIKRCYSKSDEVIEVFDQKIDRFYHTRGKNPALVLEQFLDKERYGVEVLEKRLDLRITEDLFKRHPADLCRRVCKALAPLYAKQPAVENEIAPAGKITTGVKMKL